MMPSPPFPVVCKQSGELPLGRKQALLRSCKVSREDVGIADERPSARRGRERRRPRSCGASGPAAIQIPGRDPERRSP